VSLLLVGEKERDKLRKLFSLLGRTMESVCDFPINPNYFNAVRERVQLARRIDKVKKNFIGKKISHKKKNFFFFAKISHIQNKATSQEGWVRKLAEEADLDLDDDMELDFEMKKPKMQEKNEAIALKRSLSQLLSKPLFPKVFF
jgi:ATP-dependent RNA helicase DDX24/MAK5